jgi:levoglucosan dehydrogenase
MKPIRIGLVGYGGIGRVHAAAYRAIPYHYGLHADAVTVVGVATSHRETAENAANEIGCNFWTNDYRQLLDRAGIDVIDCCTRNDSHEEIVIAAARAGRHIYCEKPLATSPEGGRRMLAAVESARVKAQLSFNFRFLPALMRAKQLIQDDFLGRVFSFRGRYYRSSYIDPDKPLSWRLQRDIAGGGALFDLGSHVLDLIYHLLGNFASIRATFDTVIKERPESAGAERKAPVDVDDVALVHARLVNGALGTVEVSRMGTGATNDFVVEIFGSKGAIRFSLDQPSFLDIYDVRDAGTPLGGMRGYRRLQSAQQYEGQRMPDWTMAPDFMRAHAECQYQFLRAIWNDTVPSPNVADGLHIQQTLDAAQRSSDEERWIEVAQV